MINGEALEMWLGLYVSCMRKIKNRCLWVWEPNMIEKNREKMSC